MKATVARGKRRRMAKCGGVEELTKDHMTSGGNRSG